MPSLDLNEPINWDEIDDFEGNVHDLDYDYVWESGNEGTPANIKRRRYYPPDIKRILYAMCLERSAPGMMKEGVTKSVARDMGVPLRVVQRVWRDGQTGENFHLTLMSSKMCHLESAILFVT
ncbi:hypothetical protein HU200_035512 [Digitaria exilis]|uniref:DUF7769 domain-containing protein n=1 Tax=Digitaria exilis TaxID=1010633 RepID=A0A835BF27_9POAL|nr:hypothetical protein HU200_050130 [Digitaria exilis]KAF8698007.1 hypothetical protein HU200_035512 [Digitaria exilis]